MTSIFPIRVIWTVAIVVTTFLTVIPAGADSLMIPAVDAGFVTPTGSTDKFDGTISPATMNYSVGLEVACSGGGLCSPMSFVPMQRKNYFVFDDFSGVTADIASASLLLFNPELGYESDDDSETYVVGATDPGTVPSVLAKIATIGMVSGPGDITPMLIDEAAMLFAELADSLGPLDSDIAEPLPIDFAVAEATVTADDAGVVVEVPFTVMGLSYLEDIITMDLPLVLGGTVSTATPDSPAGVPQSLFGFSDSTTTPAPTLSITLVPEPTTLATLTLTLLPLWRRHR